jgi:hypothetical protein
MILSHSGTSADLVAICFPLTIIMRSRIDLSRHSPFMRLHNVSRSLARGNIHYSLVRVLSHFLCKEIAAIDFKVKALYLELSPI